MGIVLVIVNSVFENYVQLVEIKNLYWRLHYLDNTRAPLTFFCICLVELDDVNEMERVLQKRNPFFKNLERGWKHNHTTINEKILRLREWQE